MQNSSAFQIIAIDQIHESANRANLIARLPQEHQAAAFEQCWRKDWQDKEPHLLPAKHIAAWTTAAYEAREREREQRRAERVLSPRRGPRFLPSLERFRTASKYADRSAAADIAFCVAAYSSGMEEASIQQALTDDYLSRNPSPSTRAAYIRRRTRAKARDWTTR